MFLLIFVVTAVPVICQDGGANDADSNAGLRRAPTKAANQGQSNHNYIYMKTEFSARAFSVQIHCILPRDHVLCRFAIVAHAGI